MGANRRAHNRRIIDAGDGDGDGAGIAAALAVIGAVGEADGSGFAGGEVFKGPGGIEAVGAVGSHGDGARFRRGEQGEGEAVTVGIGSQRCGRAGQDAVFIA